MRKNFEEPVLNISVFRLEDVLTSSAEEETTRDNSGGFDLPPDPF